MKAYTDLEQSKKLAEILPLESADMCYRIVAYNPDDTHVYQPYCFVGTLGSDIPCWSLAALLGVMICPNLEEYIEGVWDLITFTDNTLKTPIEIQDCKDPVDACVDMIIKLKKRGLL